VIRVLKVAHARPPLSHPSTLAEIFRHICLQSHPQTSPPTPQKSYPKFRNQRTTFSTTKKYPPPTPPQGARGVSEFVGGLIAFLCENKHTHKIGFSKMLWGKVVHQIPQLGEVDFICCLYCKFYSPLIPLGNECLTETLAYAIAGNL
jgi:hypothetical protein